MPTRRRNAETNWGQFLAAMAVVAIALYLAISGKAGEIFQPLMKWHVETSMERTKEMQQEHKARLEAEARE